MKRLRKRFHKLDADGSGSLSVDEIMALPSVSKRKRSRDGEREEKGRKEKGRKEEGSSLSVDEIMALPSVSRRKKGERKDKDRRKGGGREEKWLRKRGERKERKRRKEGGRKKRDAHGFSSLSVDEIVPSVRALIHLSPSPSPSPTLSRSLTRAHTRLRADCREPVGASRGGRVRHE